MRNRGYYNGKIRGMELRPQELLGGDVKLTVVDLEFGTQLKLAKCLNDFSSEQGKVFCRC